jgi:hypothetical protein
MKPLKMKETLILKIIIKKLKKIYIEGKINIFMRLIPKL